MTVIAAGFKISLAHNDRSSTHALSAKQLSHMDLAPFLYQLNRHSSDLPPGPPVVPPEEEGPIDLQPNQTQQPPVQPLQPLLRALLVPPLIWLSSVISRRYSCM